MRVQWMIAGVAAFGLALLTLPAMGPEPEAPGASTGQPASDGVCDAKPKAAPLNFTLKDMSGQAVRLADFKGKIILLNFWGTWCPPCRAETPSLVALQTKFKDQGLAVVGVAMDPDTPPDVQAFARDFKVNYTLLMTQEDIEDAYGPLYVAPTTFLIKKDGSICSKHMGGISQEQYERVIKALL